MRSISILELTCWSLPCAVLLAFVAGCGGGGTTSSGTGATTSGGGGGAGGGGTSTTTTTTGAGMGGGSATASTGTGLGMDGPPVPVGAPVYKLSPGAMTPIAPGTQAGFGISGDGAGSFKLIWTGNTGPGNPAVAFEGSIWTTGHFSNILLGCFNDSCALESDDVISPPDGAMGGGEHIGFKATSTNDLDGFEFTVDKEPVYFELTYDGQIQADEPAEGPLRRHSSEVVPTTSRLFIGARSPSNLIAPVAGCPIVAAPRRRGRGFRAS
jgi:hypothetical protein